MRKGRFEKLLSKVAQRYSESVSFDRRLYRHDVAGSIAHAAALVKVGIISAAEKTQIEAGLRAIEKEIDSGKFQWDESLEDIHMNIESGLTKKIGDTGAKLHTARSRNDQIALDLRLYVKDQINRTLSQLKQLQTALVNLAEKNVDVVMPGYTHLQRAQPILLAMIGMHLSRLSEDLITWNTSEFGFVEFSEEFSTGSSLMPQKKNPDMAELTRGKTGRLYGNLMSILTTLKALPSAYNRDLQEDKEALFDSVDTISAALELFAAILPELKINRERMEEAANDPNLLATDLAEYLVTKGMTFREAHGIVGKLVAAAMDKGTKLNAIALADLKKLSPLFDVDAVEVFDVRRSLAARRAIGGPSPENVKAQIKSWRNQLR